jgi:hypothetical protein
MLYCIGKSQYINPGATNNRRQVETVRTGKGGSRVIHLIQERRGPHYLEPRGSAIRLTVVNAASLSVEDRALRLIDHAKRP